jgi:polyhydroxybutyrate depolymerase
VHRSLRLACGGVTALASLSGILRPAIAQTTISAESRTLSVSGVQRSYLLYRPSQPRGASGLPLVVVLHGGSGTAAGIARHTGFTKLAKAEGFAVVYPQGIGRRWNDGRGIHAGYDDVGFVRALLDTLQRELDVDSRRIYVAGISNGAVFAHRLACDLPGTFAAIAAVAGAFPARMASTCTRATPVAVLAMQGTADPLMPYRGSADPSRRGAVLSAERSAAFWAQIDGCGASPAETRLPERSSTDGTRIEQVSYSGCRSGHPVTLYRIRGGGHTWPGGPAAGTSVGRVSREIDATTAIWRFFAASR